MPLSLLEGHPKIVEIGGPILEKRCELPLGGFSTSKFLSISLLGEDSVMFMFGLINFALMSPNRWTRPEKLVQVLESQKEY